ncbi:MAG: 3-oxoacyl-[acyl-carrier-protein] reductase [bacterium]|nr:3-oxoacyl-[acyl-carrier-protein] reductase [bacterium]MDT8366151.1 3-oxoacyl-[acyl-carrier-protein] reductase [bacterium]
MMSDRKLAIVTGGGQGIGRAIALDFAEAGINVVIADINLEAAEAAAAEVVAAGCVPLAFELNVADAGNVEALASKVTEKYGRIDYLINNAGITRDSLMMRMADDAWQSVIDINLTGTYLCSKAVIRVMMKQRDGRIVNISSVVGAMGNAGQTNYAASKAGIIGFTKSLAREVAARGITVNAVAPGFIQTAMTDALPDKAREELVNLIPNGRLGTPEDVAAAVRFLVSEDASYITGQVLHVNGGMYM